MLQFFNQNCFEIIIFDFRSCLVLVIQKIKKNYLQSIYLTLINMNEIIAFLYFIRMCHNQNEIVVLKNEKVAFNVQATNFQLEKFLVLLSLYNYTDGYKNC